MHSEASFEIQEARSIPLPKQRIQGPDFICIGMPKAGTSWLYDQLQYHPDFWMPPVKELQYLNHTHPRLKNVRRHIKRNKRRPQRQARRSPHDDRSSCFMEAARALSGEPRDILRYAALFQHKGEFLSGDISPPYAALTDQVVTDIAKVLPDVRIILLVRDPIQRMWSGLSMSHRRGNFDPKLLENAAQFRSYFEQERIADRLFPTKIVERWKRCAPNVQFRYYLFDDIEADPENVRRDIVLFLGADPNKRSGTLPAQYDRKANSSKLTMTEPIKAILVEHFADEVRECGKLFGARARMWAERYGL